MLEGEEKMYETKFRYLHHKSGKDIGIQTNQVQNQVHKLQLNSVHTDTVVMEKLEDSVVTVLRILNINYRRITPAFFKEYSNVRRLEIGCSLSIHWLFRQLPYLPSLTNIRFGRHMFSEKDEQEQLSQIFRPHIYVNTLEINYDHELYSKYSSSEKECVDSKLILVLKLAQDYFPNIQVCNIQVPKSVESEMDNFSKCFPHMYHVGEKRTRYGDGPVTFISQSLNVKRKLQSSSGHSSRQSSSSSSKESCNSPSNDKPDLVQPQPQQNSFTAYITQPKIEVEIEDPDIVILDSPTLLLCEDVGNNNLLNANTPSSPPMDQPFDDPRLLAGRRGRRREKSPSMLSGISNGSGSEPNPHI